MKTSYIIIFDTINDAAQKEAFIEAIRSSYISKLGKENTYIIISPNEITPKEIYDSLMSKIDFKVNILVIEMDYFYGNFLNDGVAEWLKSEYPNVNWIENDD